MYRGIQNQRPHLEQTTTGTTNTTARHTLDKCPVQRSSKCNDRHIKMTTIILPLGMSRIAFLFQFRFAFEKKVGYGVE